MDTSILPRLIHRTEYVTHLFLIFTNLIYKKMSFDEIFDLTAGVYFNFYNKFEAPLAI